MITLITFLAIAFIEWDLLWIVNIPELPKGARGLLMVALCLTLVLDWTLYDLGLFKRKRQ